MHRRIFLGTGLLLFTTAGTACRSVPPLANTKESADVLAMSVLDALARKDLAALEALALDEREFRDHVWPDLPAARPERNLPFSYVWGELHQKSRLALADTLSNHGGTRYEFLGVRFSRQTPYSSYVVHHEATLRVRQPSGAETDLQACGSMLSKAGAWKVFSYVVGD